MTRVPMARASRRYVAVLLSATMLALGALMPGSAPAINIQQGPSTVASPDVEYETATWTWSRYRTLGNENVAGFEVTFPPGTDVSGAFSAGRPGTVVVSGTTVRVTFDTRIGRNTNFSVSVGGVVNPPAATYPASQITFYTTDRNGNNPATQTLATGAVTIVPGPASFLRLTISTPDSGQTIDFGAIDPGATSSATVIIEVESSAPYQLARTIDGSGSLMGLTASGLPAAVQAAGTGTFSDVLTVHPPWTTDPGVSLTASVTYTAVQP